MNKKIFNLIVMILLCVVMAIGMTGCGKKKLEGNEGTNIENEKVKSIKDFAQYMNNKEFTKVVNLIDIDEYSKATKIELDKEQLENILEGINIEFYEIINIRKATEEDIRAIAEEYETYESFVETYKNYEQYAVDYKLSIDGSTAEAKDIFFIKEENGTYSLVTSKVWQGLISYNYMIMMDNTPAEGEQ